MTQKIAKSLLLLALGAWGVYGAFHPTAFGLIDGANLLFHEAGHLFFSFFGEFLSVSGGTLFQLGFPLALGLVFIFQQKDAFSASVMFWWTAQNCFGISIYIKDARSQALELVGGGDHDWTYLLSTLNVLQQDQQIGNIVWNIGLCGVIAAAAFGLRAVWGKASDAGLVRDPV